MKFALLSAMLPPSNAGQSIITYRMLADLSPDSYCLVSEGRYEASQPQGSGLGRLPGKHYRLPPPFRFNRGHRFGLFRLREALNVPVAVLQQGRRLAGLLRRERCEAVVACTGDVTHLPAAYLASRLTGVPFYAYIFDHYLYREWQNPAAAGWARRFEPRVMRRAAAVIVPNEILRDELREQYGIEPVVIHNSFDLSPYETARPDVTAAADPEEVRIVYTGDVYEAHYDAFRNLLAAVERLRRPGVKLHLYTGRPPEALAAEGISGPIVFHAQRSTDEMPRIQMEADLLFLPLAFNSPYPALVRTSATTKLGEYLAAGRPVLVHAPPDSFISWYFRRHECGVVVDRLDAGALAEAIATVLDDADLRRRLVERALERARADFRLSTAREKFMAVLAGKAAPAVAASPARGAAEETVPK